MPIDNYLIIHKEQPLVLDGANGGAEMATRRMAQFLVRAGKHVVVAGLLPEGDQTSEGVHYWNYGADYNLQTVWNRVQEKFVSFHLIAVGRAQPILESRNNPAIMSRSLLLHDRHGQDAGIALSVVSKVADSIFAVSKAHQEELIRAGADPSITSIIGNGVDTEVFTFAEANVRDPFKLVFAGALVQDKGVHLLLQAYAQLKSKFPQLSLDIFGSAGLWGRDSIFDQTRIEEQLPGVSFKGSVSQEELARGFQRAGICVVPSIWFETFGLVSIEAQATGCPVVVFKNGGLGEGIIDGKTGRVLPEVSVSDLVQALTELLSDLEQVRRFGEAAAKHARANYTWQEVATRVTNICDAKAKVGTVSSPTIDSRVGVITTWNQQCGLATYARYLYSQFEEGSFIVFAEDVNQGLISTDESFVVRCWQRRGDDLAFLERSVRASGVRILHLNFHDHSFIDHHYLLPFLKHMREQGIRLVSHLHTTYALDPRFSAFIDHIDELIVHSPESRLQVIAVGAAPGAVHVLPHGVLPIARPIGQDREVIRRNFMPQTNATLITSFGFIQPHKGVEAVIEAVSHLNARGIAAFGYLAGRVNDSHPQAHGYLEELQSFAQRLGISDRITFSNRFLSEAEVADCLSVSDLVFMNYNSTYYEASGACARALGAGALVVTSLSPNFAHFGDAVWHTTSGFPSGISAELLISNSRLSDLLRSNARRYVEQNCWSAVAAQLKHLFRSWGYSVTAMPTRTSLEPQISAGASVSQNYPDSLATTLEKIEHAETLLRNGQLHDARVSLRTIIKSSPQEERAIRALATLELTENNLLAARSYFNEAHKIQPTNAKTLGGLGMCALGEGNLLEAHGLLLQSVAFEPGFTLGLKNLIFTGFALEKYQDLERALRAYLLQNPEDDEIQYCLAGCLYKQGDLNAARIVLEAVLSRNPEHENSKELLEKIVGETTVAGPNETDTENDLRLSQLEEAKRQHLLDAVYRGLDEIEQQPLTTKQLERAYILRGETLAMDSEFERAEVLFKQVLEVNPLNGRAMSGLGAISIGREDLALAEKWFNKALLQTERMDIALSGLGLCAQWQSNPDLAWEYYQKALIANPENEQALFGAVQIGMLRREFAVVERCLRAYLELRPANLDHLYSLAGCLYAQQKFADALNELEKLLLFEPAHINAIELRNIILSRQDLSVNGAASR